MDSSPFEHLTVFNEVSNLELLVGGQKLSAGVGNTDSWSTFEKCFCFFNIGNCFSVGDTLLFSSVSIHFEIIQWFWEFEVSFFHQVRDLLKSIKSIVRVKLDYSVEHFIQVRVKIWFNAGTLVLSSFELRLDVVESFSSFS